jgi:hypothetical protein
MIQQALSFSFQCDQNFKNGFLEFPFKRISSLTMQTHMKLPI